MGVCNRGRNDSEQVREQVNQDRGAVGLHAGPGGTVLGGGGVSVGEARESECERRNGSLSTHERRGWQEDRQAK